LSFECCHAGILKLSLEVSGLAAINETNMKEYVDNKISDGLENRKLKVNTCILLYFKLKTHS